MPARHHPFKLLAVGVAEQCDGIFLKTPCILGKNPHEAFVPIRRYQPSKDLSQNVLLIRGVECADFLFYDLPILVEGTTLIVDAAVALLSLLRQPLDLGFGGTAGGASITGSLLKPLAISLGFGGEGGAGGQGGTPDASGQSQGGTSTNQMPPRE